MKEAKKILRAAVRAAGGQSLEAGAKPSSRGDDPVGRNGRQSPLSASRRDAPGDIIETLPEFEAAHTVALYHALPDEVPTEEMLRRWLGIKRLALPVIDHPSTGGEPPTLSMTFREYTGEDDLDAGAFGICEPETGAVISPGEIDLMLVPGVAFDAAGRRLGRGGGFYDRYLSHPAAAHIYKVGLCRPGALVPEVPAEAHDVAMDIVITN